MGNAEMRRLMLHRQEFYVRFKGPEESQSIAWMIGSPTLLLTVTQLPSTADFGRSMLSCRIPIRTKVQVLASSIEYSTRTSMKCLMLLVSTEMGERLLTLRQIWVSLP